MTSALVSPAQQLPFSILINPDVRDLQHNNNNNNKEGSCCEPDALTSRGRFLHMMQLSWVQPNNYFEPVHDTFSLK